MPQNAHIGIDPNPRHAHIGPDPRALSTALDRLRSLVPVKPEPHIGMDPRASLPHVDTPDAFLQDPQMGAPNVGGGDEVANEDPSPIQTIGASSHWNMNPLDALRALRGKLQTDSASLNPNGVRQVAHAAAQAAPQEPIAWPNAPKPPSVFTTSGDGPGTPNVPDYGVGDVANDDTHPLLKMTNTPAVLEGLRAAQSNPVSQLYGLQDKLRDEIGGNLAKAQGAGSTFMTGATPFDLKRLDQDIAESPVTQAHAQGMDASQRQFEAGQAGFGSPQEAGRYGRAVEMAKVNSPADVARITAKGNLDVQGARDMGSDSFLDRMMAARGAGLDPGTVIRGPGGTQFSTAPVSPGAAGAAEKSIEQLTRELNALQNPGGIGPFKFQNPLQDTAALITAKRAELAQAQARATGRPVPTASGGNAPVDPGIAMQLRTVGPGRHTFDDGSVYMKDASGNITKVQ